MSRLIVDGNSVLMSAKQSSLHVEDGLLYSFINSFLLILKEAGSDEVIVAWDKGPSWRKEIYPEYKENRKVSEPTQQQQEYFKILNDARNWLKDNFQHFGITQMWYENGEADDIAGWLTTAYRDKPNVLYSKDKDWLMLVDDNTTLIYKNTKRGLYITVDLDNFEVESYWKNPEEFLLAKCAIGDAGDNVAGLKGIGPQTMRKYLEGRAAENSKKRLDEFFSGSEHFKLNLKLMDIRAAVIEKPIFKIAACYSEERVLSLLAEKGFVSLLNRKDKWLKDLRKLDANFSSGA